MILEAGRIGAESVRRGRTASEAMDVVLARVRDQRKVRVGAPLSLRIARDEATIPLVLGAAAFIAAGTQYGGRSAGQIFPIAFSFLVGPQIFFGVRGLTRRRWKLTLLGLAMSAAAVLVFFVPSLQH